MNRPRISVIICTYNRFSSLSETLESLMQMVIPSDMIWEIIMVDNNSNDKTKTLVETYAKERPTLFKYIFEGRQGKSFALNTGVEAARGDILAFTDDDVLLDRNWLIAIKDAFDKYPKCRAFGGKVIARLPDRIPSWIVKEGPYWNIGGPIGHYDKGDVVRSYYEDGMYAPCGANMFFSKNIFLDYGNFNESLNLWVKSTPMFEDTEFCFRLLNNKEEIFYIPNAIVYHKVPADKFRKNYSRKWYFKRGRSSAITEVLPASTVRYLNIPRFIFRTFLQNIFEYIISIILLNRKRRILYEIRTIRVLGAIYEYFTKGRKECPRNKYR